jgi:hypothetical protein
MHSHIQTSSHTHTHTHTHIHTRAGRGGRFPLPSIIFAVQAAGIAKGSFSVWPDVACGQSVSTSLAALMCHSLTVLSITIC